MKRTLLLSCLITVFTAIAVCQSVTLPPSGDNQKCAVTQNIGSLVKVTVKYSSPDVTSPAGENRTGKIWGTGIAHYGMIDQGFGLGKPAPWRAGANESTTIHFSHDVLIGGKPLAAGSYGLFLMLAENGPWTWIFSKNTSGWGSYFYEEKDDVLRVQVQPQDHPFTEWLTYTFTDRKPTEATLELQWELKSIPMHISVPHMNDLYIAQIEKEFQGSTGFVAANYTAAANFLLEQNHNLPKALEWVNEGMRMPFFGRTNFESLTTQAQILLKMNNRDEAMAALEKAVEMPDATVFQLHHLGRNLVAGGAKQEALRIFTLNYEKHNAAWPASVGMARGLSAVGRYDEALEYAKVALAEAPDQVNKDSLARMIEMLKEGKDVN